MNLSKTSRGETPSCLHKFFASLTGHPRMSPDSSTPSHSRSRPTGTPEQAVVVFELIDDLREQIWSIYQTDLQHMTRQQRHPAPLDPPEVADDPPF